MNSIEISILSESIRNYGITRNCVIQNSGAGATLQLKFDILLAYVFFTFGKLFDLLLTIIDKEQNTKIQNVFDK